MSRIRTIKPEMTLDEEFSELGFAARLFFIHLLCHCDREGRCEDRPKMLKALIMPWDDIDVDVLLSELSPKFIVRYEIEGKRYLQVRQFKKHQRPNSKEAASEIPCCPNDILEKHEKDHASTKEIEGIREGEGKGKGRSIAPRPTVAEPAVLVFPTHGKEKTWGLTQSAIDSLKADFPAIDVLAQCRAARAWCEANSPRRKTPGGMPKFLAGWMARQQNGGNYNAPEKKFTLAELNQC